MQTWGEMSLVLGKAVGKAASYGTIKVAALMSAESGSYAWMGKIHLVWVLFPVQVMLAVLDSSVQGFYTCTDFLL